MAKEYLEVQKELQWMTKYCNELVEHLEEKRKQRHVQDSQVPAMVQPSSELQRSVEEYVQLENEKKSLVQLHRNLKEQLNRVRSEQLQQLQQQQQQQPPSDHSRSPPLPDDGWVVLSRT